MYWSSVRMVAGGTFAWTTSQAVVWYIGSIVPASTRLGRFCAILAASDAESPGNADNTVCEAVLTLIRPGRTTLLLVDTLSSNWGSDCRSVPESLSGQG